MPRITISYRRDDSGVITGRIFDRLAAHYGRESVFRDIDNIPPGVDFRKHIDEVLDESDIVLAIVGPKWVGPRANQSRLANAADPVRVEIETALRKNKPLIPVLVLRANMPRPEQLPDNIADFAFRHALAVDASQDFDVHIDRVIRSMNRLLDASSERAARDGVEQFGGLIKAAPRVEIATQTATPSVSEPEHHSRNPSPDQPAAFPAEIEALREVNRVLQVQITAAREQKNRVEDAPSPAPPNAPEPSVSGSPVPRGAARALRPGPINPVAMVIAVLGLGILVALIVLTGLSVMHPGR